MCPCGSGKSYETCCQIYHQNYSAPTAEFLMRSRYSAFVFGLVDYLYDTTHPSHRTKYLREEITATCQSLVWTKLEVLQVWQGGENDKVGKVSFRASFIEQENHGVHSEHSRFKRFGKVWKYVDGAVKE